MRGARRGKKATHAQLLGAAGDIVRRKYIEGYNHALDDVLMTFELAAAKEVTEDKDNFQFRLRDLRVASAELRKGSEVKDEKESEPTSG